MWWLGSGEKRCLKTSTQSAFYKTSSHKKLKGKTLETQSELPQNDRNMLDKAEGP